MQKKEQVFLTNSKVKDSGSKMIFDEPILCAQFIRDYVNLPYMKDVKPEDIEDVSEQFVPLFAEERNADRVKKVTINGDIPFFMISLIEHKIGIEYNVCMQIFRYMVYIWEAFEKEAERKQTGITKRKDFKYPPILPIIYYEGSDSWTAPLDFKSRINHGDVFGKYVPDFQYYLVPICHYSNEELLNKADEISLIMLLNKLQTEEDIEEFWQLPSERLEDILKGTPKYLLDIITNVMLAFLLKANVPAPEAEEFVGKVGKKKMAELFENIKIDFQEMRRKAERRIQEADERIQEADERIQEADERIQEADERIQEADERIQEADERIQEADERIQEADKRIQQAEVFVENSLRLSIENCREFGLSRDETAKRLADKFEMDNDSVCKWLEKYW